MLCLGLLHLLRITIVNVTNRYTTNLHIYIICSYFVKNTMRCFINEDYVLIHTCFTKSLCLNLGQFVSLTQDRLIMTLLAVFIFSHIIDMARQGSDTKYELN